MDETSWHEEIKKKLDDMVYGYPVCPSKHFGLIEELAKMLAAKDKRIAELEDLVKGSIIGG